MDNNVSSNKIESLKEQLMVFDILARHFENVYLLNMEKKLQEFLN